MGCGPPPRRKSDCKTGSANLDRAIPAFHTPSGPSGRLPRFAEKEGAIPVRGDRPLLRQPARSAMESDDKSSLLSPIKTAVARITLAMSGSIRQGLRL